MNIGVIGWWRHDNQGDLAILENMKRALEPHRLIPIDAPFDMNKDVLRRLNLLDFVLLGGGGLFQQGPPRPFDKFDVWGVELETPVGVAGLGIDALPSHLRAAAEALAGQARFFYVRDPGSQEIMNHPKVQVAPDLSFLYPLPLAGKPAASAPRIPVCGVNLRKLAGFDPLPWIEVLRGLTLELRAIPFTSYGAAQEIEILRQLDQTCPASFSVTRYEGLDLMVGMAFHSLVFAIQAAVPIVAIAGAAKVRRLMAEMELKDYVLEPDEWQRLPDLIERVLADQDRLAGHLREATESMSRSARRAMAAMREEIERTAHRRVLSGPKVSVVVGSKPSNASHQATLMSCVAQNYDNLEVIFAGDGGESSQDADPVPKLVMVPSEPSESAAAWLNRAFSCATGEYLTWITPGNSYTPDAVAYMVDWLQQRPDCDLVFTDFYTLGDRGRLGDLLRADSADKLFRRDVVGPSFLYRRRLAEALGPFRTDTPLPGYDYWLRAQARGRLQPVHTPLLYALQSNVAVRNERQAERRVRRQWRATKPWPVKAFWRVADAEFVENWIVQPLLAARRRMSASLHRHGGLRRV